MSNMRDPRIEPWGTPHVTYVCTDGKLHIDTNITDTFHIIHQLNFTITQIMCQHCAGFSFEFQDLVADCVSIGRS